jgi:nickel/cobalt exporter
MKVWNSNHLIACGLNIVCLAFLLFPMAAGAHPLGEVVQETYVWHRGDHLLLDYKTTIGPSISASLQPDRDKDGRISGPEEDALLKKIVETITPNLEIAIDGQRVEPKYFGGVIELYTSGAYVKGIAVQIQYTLGLDRFEEGEAKSFLISDHNFLAGELSSLTYFMPLAGKVADLSILDAGRTFGFRFWPGQMIVDKSGSAPSAAGSKAAPLQGREGQELASILQSPELGPGDHAHRAGAGLWPGSGSRHRTGPRQGHGGGLSGGQPGGVKDAVFLGGVVTFTHVISVILLGTGHPVPIPVHRAPPALSLAGGGERGPGGGNRLLDAGPPGHY